MRQALALLEQPQLAGGIGRHVAVRADAVATAQGDEGRQREDAVAEIGLGRRTQADDRLPLGNQGQLGVGQVGAVDQAPALVDLGDLAQQLQRPPAEPLQAVADLLGLLGDVDVDRHRARAA